MTIYGTNFDGDCWPVWWLVGGPFNYLWSGTVVNSNTIIVTIPAYLIANPCQANVGVVYDWTDQGFLPVITNSVYFEAPHSALASVQGPTAQPGNTKVALSWSSVAAATSYQIFRATESQDEGPNPTIIGIPGTSYTDIGLTNGQTYYYTIEAVSSSATSGESREVSATPAPSLPAPALSTRAGNAFVVLSWPDVAGATSYNVYRAATATATSPGLIAGDVAATDYRDTGLTNGTTYYYWVAAVDVFGASSKSKEVSSTPMAKVPSAPTDLTAVGLDGAIGLSWIAPSGATSYNIYRGTKNNDLAEVETGRSATSYVDTGLTDGTTYYYQVTAEDWDGTSTDSNSASAAPIAPANRGLLVLQNSSTHQIAFWNMSGATVTSDEIITPTPSPDWDVVGCADFNGDGQPDLLFQEPSTGDLAVWYMNGTTRSIVKTFPQSPSAEWRVVGVGDFNADGHPDLCLRNASNGQIAIWLLDGLYKIGGAVLPWTPGAGWLPVGVGDFNGDGYADILFQQTVSSTAGTYLAAWYMQGTARTGIGNFPQQADAGQSVVAVDNLTAAVEPNIVLESGSTVDEWTLSGLTVSGSGALSSTVPSGWSVVGPR